MQTRPRSRAGEGQGRADGATVTLAAEDKSYNKSVTLTNADAGTAKFADVPLNKAMTVTVRRARTPRQFHPDADYARNGGRYKWHAIEVSWPDASAVPLPSTPVAPQARDRGRQPAARLRRRCLPRVPDDRSATRRTACPTPDNPLSGIVSTVVSLLFLGGVGYGLYWAYQNGHLKNLLDKLGIQTQPVAAGGPQGSPFDKPQNDAHAAHHGRHGRPAHRRQQFAGMARQAWRPAPVASAGPRLVGTMGAYAGNIFPLNSTALDIGRDAGNPVPCRSDTNASRRHATMQFNGGQATVTDNGSSNGTFVNGVRIAEPDSAAAARRRRSADRHDPVPVRAVGSSVIASPKEEHFEIAHTYRPDHGNHWRVPRLAATGNSDPLQRYSCKTC